jgi:endonuclease/exonuclease/phosphatase family metal-dependent hydrolase
MATIRIATWNLERPKAKGWRRNPLLLAKLREIDADMWVLTETNAAISLVPAYKQHASQSDAPGCWTYLNHRHNEGENATTIWSRYEIMATHATVDDSIAVCVDVNSPLGIMRVYGTILTWHADRGPDGTSPNWHEHYRAIQQQGADWAKLASPYPFVVAGDFNTTLRDERYYGTKKGRELLRERLHAAQLYCATSELPQTIDHVCVPKVWADRIVNVECWQGTTPEGKPLSDHHGVIVTIRSD